MINILSNAPEVIPTDNIVTNLFIFIYPKNVLSYLDGANVNENSFKE